MNILKSEQRELRLRRQLARRELTMFTENAKLREALAAIGNKIGGPTMNYSPAIERKELLERIEAVYVLVRDALSMPDAEITAASLLLEIAAMYGLDNSFMNALPHPSLAMWRLIVLDNVRRQEGTRLAMEKFRAELLAIKFPTKGN